MRAQPSASPETNARSLPADGYAMQVLHFPPTHMLAGVVYHLIDEGLARRVDERSVDRILNRLVKEGASCSISRGEWMHLSNRQRLDWLMERAGACASVELGGIAVLQSRKGGGFLGMLGMGGMTD